MPRIKLTPTVKIALWALRIYLLILVTLIAIKFVRVFTSTIDKQPPTSAHSAGQ
jgi:uncharacterized ion transporter superfamily protein YfcC